MYPTVILKFEQQHKTYCKSWILFLIVDKSIGLLIIFLYVGNCFVLTGKRKGHASSWHSRSSNNALHGASSFINFLEMAFSFFWAVGEPAFILELEMSLWLQDIIDCWWLRSSFVVVELWEGAGLKSNKKLIKIS